MRVTAANSPSAIRQKPMQVWGRAPGQVVDDVEKAAQRACRWAAKSAELQRPKVALPACADPLPLDLHALRTTGYAVLACPEVAPLAEALIAAAGRYFALPSVSKEGDRRLAHQEIAYKTTPSSEGFFIRDSRAPKSLLPAARPFWRWANKVAQRTLRAIAYELKIPAQELLALVDSPLELPGKTSQSILRLIRSAAQPMPQHDHLTGLQHTPPLPTQAHTDLGLLAIGLRTAPGLQAADPTTRAWHPVEQSLSPTDVVVMVGDTLSNLTNRRYLSCLHRVVAGPDERLSIVFHLRLKRRVMLESMHLNSSMAGPFAGHFCETSDAYIKRALAASPDGQQGQKPMRWIPSLTSVEEDQKFSKIEDLHRSIKNASAKIGIQAASALCLSFLRQN